MSNEGLGFVADACAGLRRMRIYGCSQVRRTVVTAAMLHVWGSVRHSYLHDPSYETTGFTLLLQVMDAFLSGCYRSM